jgi:hypothetical protein
MTEELKPPSQAQLAGWEYVNSFHAQQTQQSHVLAGHDGPIEHTLTSRGTRWGCCNEPVKHGDRLRHGGWVIDEGSGYSIRHDPKPPADHVHSDWFDILAGGYHPTYADCGTSIVDGTTFEQNGKRRTFHIENDRVICVTEATL